VTARNRLDSEEKKETITRRQCHTQGGWWFLAKRPETAIAFKKSPYQAGYTMKMCDLRKREANSDKICPSPPPNRTKSTSFVCTNRVYIQHPPITLKDRARVLWALSAGSSMEVQQYSMRTTHLLHRNFDVVNTFDGIIQ
jgi:hypothetical protein